MKSWIRLDISKDMGDLCDEKDLKKIFFLNIN